MKEVKKRKIDFTGVRMQRGRKTKRRIVILECISVKNIFWKGTSGNFQQKWIYMHYFWPISCY